MDDQSDEASSAGSGGKSGTEGPLPCSDQSAEAIRAWCAGLSVGDCVGVRFNDNDGLVRYAVTSVIEVLGGYAVVVDRYGTFDPSGSHVFMPGMFQLVQPSAAVREAAAEGRASEVPGE